MSPADRVGGDGLLLDAETLSDRLLEAQVEFIVVGGIGAVLNGAPLTTYDLVIVHRRERVNVERLVGLLGEIGAYYRIRPDLRVLPSVEQLLGGGRHLLSTDFGPLDLLGTLLGRLSFEDLLPESVGRTLGERELRVQNLSSLIRVKEELASEEDLAVLPLLRKTLAESAES